MKHLYLTLVYITCCLLISNKIYAFTTQYYGNTKHKALSNHCWYEDLELAVPVNQTLYPIGLEHYCVKIHCREDYVLTIKHCDRILTPRGCSTTPYNYSKPYPYCCYKVVCA